MDKYDLPLFREQPKLYRLIPGNRVNWLIAKDVLNIGDHIYSHDPEDNDKPRSQLMGFGGSTLTFKLDTNEVYVAKGPWHSNAGGLLRDTGLDVSDLHATMVTLWSVEDRPVTFKTHVPVGDGRLEYKEVTEPRPVKMEVLYQEETPVLGTFMRGDRIAHAYANATGKRVYVRRESSGGGSEHLVLPNQEMHPMAKADE